MILFALMSVEDSLPAGIPKCGIKTELEAAEAGLDRGLYQPSRTNNDGIGYERQTCSLSYGIDIWLVFPVGSIFQLQSCIAAKQDAIFSSVWTMVVRKSRPSGSGSATSSSVLRNSSGLKTAKAPYR